jgi:hypothetical protein
VARIASNLAALLIQAEELDDAMNLLEWATSQQTILKDQVGLTVTAHNIGVLQRKRLHLSLDDDCVANEWV